MSTIMEILNATPLSKVLEEVMGAEENVDGIKNQWKICKGDTIKVVGDQWYNWQAQKGGTGAISLVSHWFELYGNTDQNKIKSQTIEVLTGLNENLVLKKELEDNLKNDKVEIMKIKI